MHLKRDLYMKNNLNEYKIKKKQSKFEKKKTKKLNEIRILNIQILETFMIER